MSIIVQVRPSRRGSRNGVQLIESEAPGSELQICLDEWMTETPVRRVILSLLLPAWPPLPVARIRDACNVVPTTSQRSERRFVATRVCIAYFSPAVQWAVIPFMLIAGMNFALLYLLLQDEYAAFLPD